MRKIRFFRHSLKKGEFISPEGFQLIEDRKDSIPQVSKIFVSPYVRTIQTAAHMMAVTEQKKVEIIQLESFGNPEVEKKIFAHEALMADFASDPNQNIYKLLDKHFTRTEIEDMEWKSAYMIHEIWDKVNLWNKIDEKVETVIAIGHSPYIKMALNGIIRGGYPTKMDHENMSEMDYIDIEI